MQMEKDCFDNDGVLVGWYIYCPSVKQVVFIPRNERHVEEDRAIISALLSRVRHQRTGGVA